MTEILGFDHVQLAMPAGQEAAARAFYIEVLGFAEEPKPANLAARGGVWFRAGEARVHLGVDADFRAARKAHPAILVRGLADLAAKCNAAGFPPVTDEPLRRIRALLRLRSVWQSYRVAGAMLVIRGDPSRNLPIRRATRLTV